MKDKDALALFTLDAIYTEPPAELTERPAFGIPTVVEVFFNICVTVLNQLGKAPSATALMENVDKLVKENQQENIKLECIFIGRWLDSEKQALVESFDDAEPGIFTGMRVASRLCLFWDQEQEAIRQKTPNQPKPVLEKIPDPEKRLDHMTKARPRATGKRKLPTRRRPRF